MKKIGILLVCLVLTGCNVKYNIKIDDDLKVSESAFIEGDSELYQASYKTSRNKILQGFLDIYGETLGQFDYTYELVKGENPHVEIKRQYNNISDYLDGSKLFNNYFDKIDYKKDGNIVKIETIGYNQNITDDPERFYVHYLDIVVNLPYKVTNHNASIVDEETNTYHFIMQGDMEDFKVLLEFDASRKFNPHMKIIIKILTALGIIALTWIIVFYLNRQKKYNM